MMQREKDKEKKKGSERERKGKKENNNCIGRHIFRRKGIEFDNFSLEAARKSQRLPMA